MLPWLYHTVTEYYKYCCRGFPAHTHLVSSYRKTYFLKNGKYYSCVHFGNLLALQGASDSTISVPKIFCATKLSTWESKYRCFFCFVFIRKSCMHNNNLQTRLWLINQGEVGEIMYFLQTSLVIASPNLPLILVAVCVYTEYIGWFIKNALTSQVLPFPEFLS